MKLCSVKLPELGLKKFLHLQQILLVFILLSVMFCSFSSCFTDLKETKIKKKIMLADIFISPPQVNLDWLAFQVCKGYLGHQVLSLLVQQEKDLSLPGIVRQQRFLRAHVGHPKSMLAIRCCLCKEMNEHMDKILVLYW